MDGLDIRHTNHLDKKKSSSVCVHDSVFVRDHISSTLRYRFHKQTKVSFSNESFQYVANIVARALKKLFFTEKSAYVSLSFKEAGFFLSIHSALLLKEPIKDF